MGKKGGKKGAPDATTDDTFSDLEPTKVAPRPRSSDIARIDSIVRGSPDPPASLLSMRALGGSVGGGGEGGLGADPGGAPALVVRPLRDFSKKSVRDCSVASEGLADLRKNAAPDASELWVQERADALREVRARAQQQQQQQASSSGVGDVGGPPADSDMVALKTTLRTFGSLEMALKEIDTLRGECKKLRFREQRFSVDPLLRRECSKPEGAGGGGGWMERLGSEGGREEGRLEMRGTGGVWEGRSSGGKARVRRGRELTHCCVTAFEAYDVASVSR
jgi:hypothetical protein